ncbi:protein-glutamine gamma-glutamyltransferase [Paenibacillus graminis]|uniref:protein-glutamine gamma-glutamyltransferase n=1 Tax=Paenibacillus graminis TaxID=189425 RepID=UPI002DBF0F21|nr:protein-glutamine gamma-glutamyltransferase [Paenibacillus graminis]MEC0167795.1 protein-glutamine gamma-glutamyltransferase [Paenibacillus graminis]
MTVPKLLRTNRRPDTYNNLSIVTRKGKWIVAYGYGNPDSGFERSMRERIIETAKAMSVGGTDFSTFKDSRCNPKYWIRTANGGFQLRSDVAPSAAINDIFVNGRLYAFECAMAMVMIFYKATIDMIGEDAFNQHFTDLFLWDWNYDSNLRLITTFDPSEMEPGDVVYFKNPDHDPDKPEWQGENAVMLGNDSYYGHGLGIKSANAMIASLNRERVPGSRTSAYLTDEALHPDFAYIQTLASRSAVPLKRNGDGRNKIFSRIGVKSYVIK